MEARLWRTTASHTTQLMPAVAELLAARKLPAVELVGVAVALGPGPFSALRVGVSAAKGMAMAAGYPIIGIDTLALEAMPHLTPDGIVSVWLDAGRNEVAAAWFRPNGRVRADAIDSPDALLDDEPALPDGALIYCGEAANSRRDAIRNAHAGGLASRPTAVAPWTPANRLWTLAHLAARRLRDGHADELATLQPYYLRMPTIGAPKRRGIVRQGRSAPPLTQN